MESTKVNYIKSLLLYDDRIIRFITLLMKQCTKIELFQNHIHKSEENEELSLLDCLYNFLYILQKDGFTYDCRSLISFIQVNIIKYNIY